MAPTTADLIEALRKPGESYEALAARLPISLSTVNRWKRESPQDWDGLLQMLEAAGWLNMAADVPQGDRLPADPLERLAVAARDQGEVLGTVLEEIRGLRAEVSAVATSGQARPKRKGAR